MSSAIGGGAVRACHDLSDGGLAVAAAETAFAGELGLELDLAAVPVDADLPDAARLFSESASRFLVEADARKVKAFEKALAGVPHARVGRVLDEPRLRVKGVSGRVVIDAPLESLAHAWRTGLRP